MSRQIIKQPNGRYCIFSSIVDDVTYYNMASEDIIDVWVKEQQEDIEKRVKEVIQKLENNEKPYHVYTMSFDEMIKHIGEIKGKEASKKTRKLIAK